MLAIIGGTGFYQLDGIDIVQETDPETPFGKVSAPIVQARYQDKDLLFLSRHGRNHQFLPHEINYRANIFALKKLGAKQIIGLSAAGSLRQHIQPGEFVIPAQYFDWVKGNRERTFFGKGVVAHISTAEPTCKTLTKWIAAQTKLLNTPLHTEKTYGCVDGPRLGTKAESHFLRHNHCDVVGMTNIPEVFLAREAQICYATICIITDYDCWMQDPNLHANTAEILSRYQKNIQKIHHLLLSLLALPLPATDEHYRQSLRSAILTPKQALTPKQQELLAVLTT